MLHTFTQSQQPAKKTSQMGAFVHGGTEGASGPQYPPHCDRDGKHDCQAHTQGEKLHQLTTKLETTVATRMTLKDILKEKKNIKYLEGVRAADRCLRSSSSSTGAGCRRCCWEGWVSQGGLKNH